MIPYDTPLTITLDGQPVVILGTDTGSYVAADGRTWPIPADTEPATDAAGVQAHIDAGLPSAASILADAKGAVRNIAQTRRAALIAAGFTYGGKLIQTRDLTDISNINGAALAAAGNPDFATAWITADNSLLALDAAGVVAMQAAMIAAGNAIYAAYVTVSAQIEAAADLAAVDALRDTAATFTP